MTPAEASEGGLLERQEVLDAAAALVGDACAGRGAALVLEAGAGMGKTSVIAAAARLGRAAGMRVAEARGGELEQEVAWGVVRELLAGPARSLPVPGPVAAALGMASRRAAPEDFAAIHGLWELCSELSDTQPLLLVVDDAHWADQLSLRCLAYFAPRLAEERIALVLAARPDDPRRPEELTILGGRDGVTVRRLAPLSEAASGAVVARLLPRADGPLRSACVEATAGNPFLLVELCRELSTRGAAGAGPDSVTLSELAIDRVDRMTARRLATVGDDAARMARAASVFGVGGDPMAVAAAADLDGERARRAADALRGADILAAGQDRLAFTHPLLRAAVQRSIPPSRQSELHLRAARWLHDHDFGPPEVAAHLLAVEPRGDPWVRDRLIEAGDDAARSGAPRNAVTLFQRAEAERAGPAGAHLLAKLGRAAMGHDPAAARQPLMRALEATPDPLDKVPLALDLAVVLQTIWRTDLLMPLLEELIEDLEESGAPPGVVLRVEAELLAQAYFNPATRDARSARLPLVVAKLTGEVEEEALIAVQQGIDATNHGTAEEVRLLADKAWAEGSLPRLAGSPVTPAAQWVPYFHLYVDDYQWAEDLGHQWMDQAQKSGSAVLTVFASTLLAEVHWRSGALADAAAVAGPAWDIASQLGRRFPGWWISLSSLAQVRVSAGAPQDAVDLLDGAGLLDGPPPDMLFMPLPRAVRAEALLAAGFVERGVSELADTMAWVYARGDFSPGAWRFPASLVDGLLVLGRREEAGDVARDWMRRTERFGTASTYGMAVRAVALASTGGTQLEGLAAAERVLAGTPARAEHARALLELGAALRRAGRRSDALEPLRTALDKADRCGAGGMAQRARDELVAAGARPRRSALTGVGALSPSERRVAQLASDGLTNRQIAGALFISRKTVERHLANIYNKLGTNRRDQLGGLMAAG